ncbi:MAG: hypothetical protein EHM72_03205 [Calditrichaeota bacterium]|nr:MAG: hypothetical protein EHM72_20285 [Calditrichota bacterium]RPI02836.1 MAG: hypothetical protein EHM72_03205 [Calditrichota bacterium]
MPDLITHSIAAYWLLRLPRFARFRVIFYLGTILPDILARPIHILWPQLSLYSVAIHTPVFMVVCALLAAEFFAPALRTTIRTFLLLGIGLHFFLDFFQIHLGDGYYWFFPFSWKSFEIGLFWPETSIRLLPLWLILIAGFELTLRLIKSR